MSKHISTAMRGVISVGVVLLLVQLVSSKKYWEECEDGTKARSTRSSEPNNRESAYRSKWAYVGRRIDSDVILKRELVNQRIKKSENGNFEFGPPVFNCDVTASRPKGTPSSVHELSPYDVNVVAAMGDSITAGFGVGADKFVHVFKGNRGESWSIGGKLSLDEGVVTLPNILKKFNPNLEGSSTCYSERLSEDAGLNVAEGGDTSRDMPGQAEDIVNICKLDERIDNENDWKIITMLVGGNDLCLACQNSDYNATNYARNIERALDILHSHIPKAFVNIVPMFDISNLKNFSKGLLCRFIQPRFCPCGVVDQSDHLLKKIQLQYYEKLQELIDSGKYDTRGDFTAVIQPMFVNLVPPTNPETGTFYKSFLSYDCFHPTKIAHQLFAYSLWNTMLTPMDEKPLGCHAIESNPAYVCPTDENPFFATKFNSKPRY